MHTHSTSFRHGLRAALLGTALAAAAALPAQAQNLLVNGGFESGTLAGWTQSGDTGFTFASCGFLSYEGSCAAALGSTSTGMLSQSLGLTAGTTYVLRLNLLGYGDNPSTFGAFLNGVQMMSVSNPSTSGAFQAYQATVTASTALNVLELRFSDAAGFMWLDNVQLAPVPEPAAAWLLLLGLAGLSGLKASRRRRGWSG